MTSTLVFVIRFAGTLDRIQQVEVGETTIGRQASNVLCLPDTAVSRKHAVLSRERTEYLIRDLGSHNGTLLNGQRIVEAVLPVPAVLDIGPYQLKVFGNLNSAEAEAEGMVDSTRNQPLPASSKHDREEREQRLTPMQDLVYQEFLRGRTEKEVACALKLSINTVHTHARAIYQKFEVSSRGELLALSAGHFTSPG